MKTNKFDVVELNNGNKATILDIIDKNTYFVEIVDNEGKTIDRKNIYDLDIKEVIFTK